jgi:hypothetical protein
MDVDGYRARPQLPRHGPGQPFLKGPVPLAWLSRAAGLPGKALAVALALWYAAGLTKGATVLLSRRLLRLFHVGRHAAGCALVNLERSGLVSVERGRGRCPRVTLLPPPRCTGCGADAR